MITGIGVVSPIGNDYASFSRNLTGGRSGSGTISLFDAGALLTRVAAEVKGFKLSDFVDFGDPSPYRSTWDRKAEFGIAACQQALADSRHRVGQIEPTRVASSFGAGLCYPSLEELQQEVLPYTADDGSFDYSAYAREMSRARLERRNRYLFDQVALWLRHRVKAAGGSHIHFSACAASTQAVGHALDRIRDGEIDVCFAGGYDAQINPFVVAGFNKLGAVTCRNDPPEKASRPFDKTRDGFLLGEGAAAVVMEAYERIPGNSRKIYGEILGYGSSLDAHEVTAPHPKARGAVLSMQRALRDAGISAEDVDYVNAHGTGTPLNDPMETRAIHETFGQHAGKLAVSSSKSMFGHLLAASGAIELVACLVALGNQILPPTINLENPDPACDLDYVPRTARKAGIRVAMSNSFGFGGQNATLIVAAPEK